MWSLPRGRGGCDGGSSVAETGDRAIRSTGGLLRAQGLPTKQQKGISCPIFSWHLWPCSSRLPDSALSLSSGECSISAEEGHQSSRTHLCYCGHQPLTAAPPQLRTEFEPPQLDSLLLWEVPGPSQLQVLGTLIVLLTQATPPSPGPLSPRVTWFPCSGGFLRQPELRPHRHGHQEDVVYPVFFFHT